MMHPSANGPQVFQQAEMADASKQNDEADVEEVHIPPAPAATGKGKSNKVVTRIKLSNFNPDEDLNVVKSWLEINCAPIISNVGFAQKKDRVWDRIMHRYNLRRGSYPERSVRSLQSRWDTIKAEVKKFSSFYADAIRENPSGMSDADKTTHAAANFAVILKQNFAYIHCWEIMKDEPKWQDPKLRPFAKSAGGEGFGEDSRHGPDTNDFGEHNSSPTGHAEEWPMGLDFAEMADASKQNDEADVEEVHIPPAPAATGKGKSNKVVTRTKLSNFKPDEDVNIVKSWLEINCDPITSTAPKKHRMWDRIMHRYNLRRGSYPERSLKSLQNRWDIIKAEVGKFSSFYADAIRENPSGMPDADKTTHAAANFAGTLKRYFAYMHCWEIMKDEPKWQDPKPRPFAKSAGGEGFGEDSSNGPDTNVAMMHPSANGPQVFQQAEMADASKQKDEADVEEVHILPAPAATGEGKSNKVVTRTKLSNFNPDEDVNIVKSWLEISCDPITSTAQKEDRVWDRIMHRYNLRRGSYPERSLRSLQSRWDIIKAEVRQFSFLYADAIRENPSGMSDADKTTHAAANFASILKHNFAYMHCWEIMKDEPKWQDPKPRPFAKSAGGEGFGEDSSHGPDTNDLGEHNSSPTGHAEKRPMSRDSAKVAKKTKNSSAGSTSSAEYASRMQDVPLQKNSILQEESARKNDRFQQLACVDEKWFEEMRRHNQSLLDIEQGKIHIEQEKVRMMREKHDMDRQEKEKREDERILGIDLNACTPAQRMYYEALQEEIFEKIAARRRKRQGP